jgi:Tubulin-tyrosine ligase family
MIDACCYLHTNVLCSPHALAYDSGQKSAHVSGMLRQKHQQPQPVLLEDLHPSHPAINVFELIRECSTTLMKVALAHEKFSQLEAKQVAAGVTCFALLGNDFLVFSSCHEPQQRPQEQQQREQAAAVVVKLCEVNSHPSLGWGTMQHVPSHVFAELVQDSLSILVDTSYWNCRRTYHPSVDRYFAGSLLC